MFNDSNKLIENNCDSDIEEAKLDDSVVSYNSLSPTDKDYEINLNLWSKFNGNHKDKLMITNRGCCYIVLQSLTFGYIKPCVLDIKVGTRQYCIFIKY